MLQQRQEAWAKARGRFKEVRLWLEAIYPKAFNFKDTIPLKRGIKQDIFAGEIPFDKLKVMNALKAYVRNFRSLKTTAKGGLAA